jgi:hypothetical protein
MANKTNKKNSVTVEWPKGHFTIEEVWQKVGGEKAIPEITLRFRINKAVANKEIVQIGKVKPPIGRPKIVFARANPSKELLEAAKAAGVIFSDESKPTTVTVAEVKTEKKSKTVVPVAPAQEKQPAPLVNATVTQS